MRLFFAMILLLLCTGPARAQTQMNVDLASNHVDITTGFNGSQLSLFGVKRQPGEVAVILRGPSATATVRRKGQLFGIWMNRQSLDFEGVPVFYDLALSAPEAALAPSAVLERYEVGLTHMDFRYTGSADADMIGRFREAMIRDRQARGLFALEPRRVTYLANDFFRADFTLPPNVSTGLYTVDTLLFRDGVVVDEHQTRLRVAQVGFNARLYRFADRQALLYGLVAVLFGLAAGWSAQTFLRRD